MVRLNLIIEGGVYADSVSVETANNAEALREALHNFFTRLLNRDDIEITIFMGNGYRNAAKKFVAASVPISLFVDSDLPPDEKYQWFEKLINDNEPDKTIVIPEEKKESVFFMIQEMEAWFLKQPMCMDKWADKEGYKRKNSEEISQHSLIKGKSIENINKPSKKLEILLKTFFEKNKKAARYGKLKTAPALLDALDVSELESLDKELQRFHSFVKDK